MSVLTSDDDEEAVNFAGATIIFSISALLFGLKRRHSVWVQGRLPAVSSIRD